MQTMMGRGCPETGWKKATGWGVARCWGRGSPEELLVSNQTLLWEVKPKEVKVFVQVNTINQKSGEGNAAVVPTWSPGEATLETTCY